MRYFGGIVCISSLLFLAIPVFAQSENISLRQYLEMSADQQREIRDRILGRAVPEFVTPMEAELGPELGLKFANCFKRMTTDGPDGEPSEWTRQINEATQVFSKMQNLEQNPDENFGDLMKRFLALPAMQCIIETRESNKR
tara:strand:+ start:317 stop:739 length:423 start_codon:yes stop_codon:yes gene_type:complete